MSPARSTLRAGAAGLGMLCLAALAACAPPPAEAGLPPGVEVSFVQLRGDVASRQAQVEIVNGADIPLDVAEVVVEDPRFAGAATRVVERTSTIAPGATLHVRVQLPAVDCEVSAAAASTVSVTLDGRTATAELPDALGFVAALHERECLADALAEVVDLRLTSFVPTGDTATVDLEVVPAGSGRAQLLAVHPTPLLMYAPGAAAEHAIAVDVGGAPTLVRLPLVPQRCDPHVVQEDKRGTVFTFDVVVDGVEGQIDLAADPEMKGRMLAWVAEACGFGAGR